MSLSVTFLSCRDDKQKSLFNTFLTLCPAPQGKKGNRSKYLQPQNKTFLLQVLVIYLEVNGLLYDVLTMTKLMSLRGAFINLIFNMPHLATRIFK